MKCLPAGRCSRLWWRTVGAPLAWLTPLGERGVQNRTSLGCYFTAAPLYFIIRTYEVSQLSLKEKIYPHHGASKRGA